MAAETKKIRKKKTVSVKKAEKVKTAVKKPNSAETGKDKKMFALPKVNGSDMAQIIYMVLIILFLIFVILKYNEII